MYFFITNAKFICYGEINLLGPHTRMCHSLYKHFFMTDTCIFSMTNAKYICYGKINLLGPHTQMSQMCLLYLCIE